MKTNKLALTMLLLGICSIQAQAAERTGKEVVDTSCAACPQTGIAGARSRQHFKKQ